MGTENFAVHLGGKAGGEVLRHDERDQQRITRRPGRGSVVQQMELDRQRVAVSGDEGIHAAGVGVELMALVVGQDRKGSVCGGAQLQVALQAVMFDERRTEDLGKLTGGVAAECVHLEEAVLRRHEALREEQIVEVGSVERGHTVAIARDGDRGGQAVEMEFAVDLR